MMMSRDLQINVEADCGNAPRKAQVRDWLIALASGDLDTVCDDLDDDVCWDVAGSQRFDGIDEVRTHVEEVAKEHIEELSIRHVLSHGKQVAVEGATNSSRFAHVITYTGHGRTARVAEVISFIAPLSS